MTIEVVVRHGMEIVVVEMQANGGMVVKRTDCPASTSFFPDDLAEDSEKDWERVIDRIGHFLGRKFKRGEVEWQRLELVLSAMASRDLE